MDTSCQLKPRVVVIHFCSLQISLFGNLSSALFSQDERGSVLILGTSLFPGLIIFRGIIRRIP